MKRYELTGKTFERLTVLRFAGMGTHGHTEWHCICSCGTKKVVRGSCLVQGVLRSCGCLSIERSTTHGNAPRTGVSSEYRSWAHAKSRCECITNNKYPDYGGRGITMCERWRNSFAAFLEDMGKKPSSKHSIDRENNNGNYEPGNCRWATILQQANNKRTTGGNKYGNRINSIEQPARSAATV